MSNLWRFCALLAMVLVYSCASTLLFVMHMFLERAVADLAKTKTNLHGPLMLAGIIIIGLGTVVYRLFKGYATRIIKLMHLTLQTIGTIVLIAGYGVAVYTNRRRSGITYFEAFHADTGQTKPELANTKLPWPIDLNSRAHVMLGYVVIVAVVIQFIAGIAVFMFARSKTELTKYFAPFHHVFGLWIFLGLVGSYLTGIFHNYEREVGCCITANDSARDVLYFITIPAYVAFLSVVAVIVCPYLDWENVD